MKQEEILPDWAKDQQQEPPQFGDTISTAGLATAGAVQEADPWDGTTNSVNEYSDATGDDLDLTALPEITYPEQEPANESGEDTVTERVVISSTAAAAIAAAKAVADGEDTGADSHRGVDHFEDQEPLGDIGRSEEEAADILVEPEQHVEEAIPVASQAEETEDEDAGAIIVEPTAEQDDEGLGVVAAMSALGAGAAGAAGAVAVGGDEDLVEIIRAESDADDTLGVMDDMAEAAPDVTGKIGETVSEATKTAGDAVESAGDMAQAGGTATAAALGGVYDTAKDTVTDVAEAVGDTAETVVDKFSTASGLVTDYALGTAESALDMAKEGVSAVGEGLSDAASATRGAASDMMEHAEDAATTMTSAAFGVQTAEVEIRHPKTPEADHMQPLEASQEADHGDGKKPGLLRRVMKVITRDGP